MTLPAKIWRSNHTPPSRILSSPYHSKRTQNSNHIFTTSVYTARGFDSFQVELLSFTLFFLRMIFKFPCMMLRYIPSNTMLSYLFHSASIQSSNHIFTCRTRELE